MNARVQALVGVVYSQTNRWKHHFLYILYITNYIYYSLAPKSVLIVIYIFLFEPAECSRTWRDPVQHTRARTRKQSPRTDRGAFVLSDVRKKSRDPRQIIRSKRYRFPSVIRTYIYIYMYTAVDTLRVSGVSLLTYRNVLYICIISSEVRYGYVRISVFVIIYFFGGEGEKPKTLSMHDCVHVVVLAGNARRSNGASAADVSAGAVRVRIEKYGFTHSGQSRWYGPPTTCSVVPIFGIRFAFTVCVYRTGRNVSRPICTWYERNTLTRRPKVVFVLTRNKPQSLRRLRPDTFNSQARPAAAHTSDSAIRRQLTPFSNVPPRFTAYTFSSSTTVEGRPRYAAVPGASVLTFCVQLAHRLPPRRNSRIRERSFL